MINEEIDKFFDTPYAWGPLSSIHKIGFNGKEQNVKKNLQSLAWRKKAYFVYWII